MNYRTVKWGTSLRFKPRFDPRSQQRIGKYKALPNGVLALSISNENFRKEQERKKHIHIIFFYYYCGKLFRNSFKDALFG